MELAVTGRTRSEILLLTLCVLRAGRQTDGSECVHCLNVNHIRNSSLHFMSKEGRDLSLFVCPSVSVYLRLCAGGGFGLARRSPLL